MMASQFPASPPKMMNIEHSESILYLLCAFLFFSTKGWTRLHIIPLTVTLLTVKKFDFYNRQGSEAI